MRFRVALADGHFITLVQFLQQPANFPWIVLTVAIHDSQDLTARRSGTALDCCTVAQALRMSNYRRTGFFRRRGRRVGRAIVDNDNLSVGKF